MGDHGRVGVVTDGENEDTNGGVGLGEVAGRLRDGEPVLVFLLTFGTPRNDAGDLGELSREGSWPAASTATGSGWSGRSSRSPPPCGEPAGWPGRARDDAVSAGGRVPGLGAPLRRRQELGLLAGGMVAAAGGCSWLGSDEEPAGDSAAFQGDGPIVVAAPRDFSLGEQRRVAVRVWNQRHATRRATSVDLPFAADLQRADLIARLQAEREDHDVLGLDVVWTVEFAEGHYIESLQAYESDLQVGRFLAPALDSARFGGDGIRDGWIPGTAQAYDEEQSRRAFQSGQAVFMRNWPYAYDLLTAQDSPVKDDVGVAKLPGPSALGRANLAISRFSRRKKTALEFIRFLATDEAQRPTFEKGGDPAARPAEIQGEAREARVPWVAGPQRGRGRGGRRRDGPGGGRRFRADPGPCTRRPRPRWHRGSATGRPRRPGRPVATVAAASPWARLPVSPRPYTTLNPPTYTRGCQVEGSSPPTLRQHAAACAAGARATSFGGETST
jgi:Bacterial extracellular solute-binding protein